MSDPKRAMRQGRRGVIGLLVALVMICASAKLFDVYALSRLPIDFPAPGQFVTIDSPAGPLKMHYICQGKGTLTLALEAGFGGGALDWTPIMPALAGKYRVCAFDRLGQDWSDSAPEPRTFSVSAGELHRALTILGIQNPVVVGHSLGGAIVQIYAAKYPVRGIILVEGLSSDVAASVVARLGSYQSLSLLATLGLLRPIGALMAHPSYPADLRNQMIALRSGSAALIRLSNEGAIAAQSAVAELSDAEGHITSPMLIIAAENSDVPGLAPGTFTAALKSLAQRKSAAFVLIHDASHYAMADHPREVSVAMDNWLSNLP